MVAQLLGGIINSIYRLGDGALLRVPRDHPGHIAQTRAEAVAIPAALARGVRTPALIAFDDACDLLSVPYTIVEWVPGVNLESLREDQRASEAWRELGRQLALLHAIERSDPQGALPAAEEIASPRVLAEHRATEGWFTSSEQRWLDGWLSRLEPAATRPVASRMLHGDTQGTNVVVDPRNYNFEAVIDWGNACWGDVALDFVMPLPAAGHVLAGHREVAPVDGDDTIEARILWRRIQIILLILPRRARPGQAWAEHPLSQLIDLQRFMSGPLDARWENLRP